MIRLLLIVSLLFLQDSAKWIEDLGSADIRVRSEARDELRKLGAKALPALRKAKDDEDLTRRTNVRELIAILEWKEPALPVTKEEKTWLEKIGALGALSSTPPATWRPKKTDISKDRIWGFIDRELFQGAKVTAGWSKIKWLARTKDASIVLRILPTPKGDFMNSFRGNAYPRAYLIRSKKIDLKNDFKWDAKTGTHPALKGVMKGKHTHLYPGGRKKFKAGMYHSFYWDQDKPFPSLRHLFVKNGWALLVIDFQ